MAAVVSSLAAILFVLLTLGIEGRSGGRSRGGGGGGGGSRFSGSGGYGGGGYGGGYGDKGW